MTVPSSSTAGYDFTSDWFTHVEPTWRVLTRELKPRAILEIGSFEGRSACWMIDTLPHLVNAGVDLVCIDRWGPGRVERPGSQTPSAMDLVEQTCSPMQSSPFGCSASAAGEDQFDRGAPRRYAARERLEEQRLVRL
jgi:hypothetical protein